MAFGYKILWWLMATKVCFYENKIAVHGKNFVTCDSSVQRVACYIVYVCEDNVADDNDDFFLDSYFNERRLREVMTASISILGKYAALL